MATTSGQIQRLGRGSQAWKGKAERQRPKPAPTPSPSAFAHEWGPGDLRQWAREDRLEQRAGAGWRILGNSETPGTWEPFPYWNGGRSSGFPPDLLRTHMEWSWGLWAGGSLGPLGSVCLLLGERLRSPRSWASFLVWLVQEPLRSGAHQGLGGMQLRASAVRDDGGSTGEGVERGPSLYPSSGGGRSWGSQTGLGETSRGRRQLIPPHCAIG